MKRSCRRIRATCCRRGTLRGRYLYPAEIRLGIKTQDGKPGYHIYTPLLLADGSAVLVNRGWAPLDWKNPLTGRSRRETILGLLQQPPQPNAFTPLNAPEKDVWYRIDLPQIAEAKKIAKLRPYVLVAEHMPQDRDFPRALPAHPALPNNHFSYAIFWFAMAAALAVVYALRFLKGKK